ncbi:MAG: hypothetical protein LH606_05410 [Cytophagaceae bacterium]|nr:hypothetical protein [Cytophagaceae bacterium]
MEQAEERGTDSSEIETAIRQGIAEPAKKNRLKCRYNFPYHNSWQGKPYAIKQVEPVFVEENDEIVVVTGYTYYF